MKSEQSQLIERVMLAYRECGYTQWNELAEEAKIDNSRVSEAFRGKNKKRLAEIVNFFIEQKGYEFTYFYPAQTETIKDVLVRMEKRLDSKIDELFKIVERLEKKMK